MQIAETEFGKGFIKMCMDGHRMGWHERNGGNFSYRIRPEEIEQIRENLNDTDMWREIGTEVPDLAGEYFLVTGSGKFFGNTAADPEGNLAVIEIDEQGRRYRICWGLRDGGVPTSELPSHLMNHEGKKEASGGRQRVIYHCHPANVIALTFVLPLKEEVFTRELWEMMTECPIIFPDGAAVISWMVPGGREIAVESAKYIKDHDVIIWAHHGMFCSGEDFDQTFGLAHTVEKAAEILCKVLAMTPQKRQTISSEGLRKLGEAFQVRLPEKFLYEK